MTHPAYYLPEFYAPRPPSPGEVLALILAALGALAFAGLAILHASP